MNDHITSAHFDLWQTIRSEAAAAAAAEPMLASFLHLTVLRHHSLDRVLAFHLSSKLSSPIMDARALFEVYLQALQSDGDIIKAVEKDILACYERDPACDEYSLPLLYFKGFHAVQAHRINHWLWQQGRKTLAYFLQNRSSEVFGTDIHPAARFGHAAERMDAPAVITRGEGDSKPERERTKERALSAATNAIGWWGDQGFT